MSVRYHEDATRKLLSRNLGFTELAFSLEDEDEDISIQRIRSINSVVRVVQSVRCACVSVCSQDNFL